MRSRGARYVRPPHGAPRSARSGRQAWPAEPRALGGLEPRGTARTPPHHARPIILESNNVAYRPSHTCASHKTRLPLVYLPPPCAVACLCDRPGPTPRPLMLHFVILLTLLCSTVPSCGRARVRFTRFSS